MPDTPATSRTEAATHEHMRKAAVRALDDPATLARAARIVREALRRDRLTFADLDPSADRASAPRRQVA